MQFLRSGRGVAAVIAVVAAAALLTWRSTLAAALIPRIVGAATGTSVTFAQIRMHATHAEFTGITVTSRRGQEIAFVPRADLVYDVHDLLPGSRHRFGLHALTIYDPQIWIVHNRDGTYNLPPQAKRAASPRAASPLDFTARIVNGRVTVVDYTRVHADARYLYLDAVNVDAAVNTAAVTQYRASLAYREGSRRYPIAGNGTIDNRSGVNLQHWAAARVPLPRLVNYGTNNPSLHMLGGALESVDLWYYGKFAGTAAVRGVKVALAQLRTPLRNGAGTIDVGSDALTTSSFTADLNGIPVRVEGGVTNLAQPALRFSIFGRGEIARITGAAAQTARLPVRGQVDFNVLAEGTAKAPVVLIALRSPQLDYHGTLIDAPSALAAFDGHEADVIAASLRYRGLDLSGRGRVALERRPHAVEMIADASGPSNAVPLASGIVSPMMLRGSVLATADDVHRIDTLGVLEGDGAQHLAGSFHVDSAGAGSVAPLTIDEPGRSMYAQIALDHPHGIMGALVHARHFNVALRGASASIDGDMYAEQRGRLLGMLGSADLSNARYGRIAIDRARARFGGTVGDVRVSSLDATGSFGSVTAQGSISGTNHLALEGHYSGSLAALSQIAGNLSASGSVDAPIALVYDGGRAVAQIRDARFANASVRGIPVRAMSATIVTQGKNVSIYAARAAVASHARAEVAGTLGRGMAVSVAGLDMRSLHRAGVPVQSGDADAGALIRGPLNAPDVTGSLLLRDAAYRGYPLDAQTAIAYSGNTLRLNGGVVGFGPALATVDGSISGVRIGGPMSPNYDLDASMRAADAHALISLAGPRLSGQDVQGSIDAAVHVSGAGSAPAISGALAVPEGAVHGLAFRDMHASLNGTAGDLRIGAGHVAIGSTSLSFWAQAGRSEMRAGIDAPRADLADFNDYFDTGDTLAGHGSVALTFDKAGASVATGGNVALSGVRFKRYEIGSANAVWSTRGRTIALDAGVGGAAGRAVLDGTVTLPDSSNPLALAAGADANLDATVSNLDLASWMPMLGYNAPVTGKLDANASVRGRFPDETIAATADVYRGTVGRIALQRAHVALTARKGRGTIDQAVVQIPYLLANGSGTFGLHAADPIDVAVRAQSPDIGALMKTVSGKPQPVSGALDTTLRVQGTRADPRLTDSLALTALRYRSLTMPRVSAAIDATRTRISLRNGLVQFARGSVTASGDVPIAMTPRVQLDPADKPVRLELSANNVDFSDFQSALPKGTRLAGTMAGSMLVGGTIDNPKLDGKIAVRNGYFVGPLDQNPISKMNGALVFSGTTVALQALHANAGAGTIDVNGIARVPNVRDLRAASFTAAIAARGAQFNSPQYFRGKVDANITASRSPGAPAALAGTVTIPSARIPLTAFWNPHAPAGPARKVPPVALNVTANAGNDVRVQSSNVDVGAQGSVIVGGNLAAPTLNGNFDSTGGTVSFFRTFSIEDAAVRFDPSNGIMPFVDATATTDVNQTYIALNVNGLAPGNMHLQFTSDPPYDSQQIMGLLAGVGEPSGPALAGAGNFSANSAVENLASGEINTFFTRQMLEPLSAELGSALGLQNLQLTDDFHSGFGLNAAKAFGKHITVVYNESMGQPQRESLSIEAHHGESSAFDLLFYQVQSPSVLAFTQNANMFAFDSGAAAMVNVPNMGTNGTSFLYEHKF